MAVNKTSLSVGEIIYDVLTNDAVRYVSTDRDKESLNITQEEEYEFMMKAQYLADAVETFMLRPERYILRFGSHSKNGFVNVMLEQPERDPSMSIGDIPNPFILPIGNSEDGVDVDSGYTGVVGKVLNSIQETYPYTVVKNQENSSGIKLDSHTLVTADLLDYYDVDNSTDGDLELPPFYEGDGFDETGKTKNVVYRENFWVNGADFSLETKGNYAVSEGNNYLYSGRVISSS